MREGRAADAAWLAPRILLTKAASRPRPAPAKNLIMLVADALRADKLPMYAESRVRVPNIAKAAAERGVTFTSTQAASPSSPPSHASIQSGCVPRKHGILGDKSKVNPGTPMVSAILAKAGIATSVRRRRRLRHEPAEAGFALDRVSPAEPGTQGRRLLGGGAGDPRTSPTSRPASASSSRRSPSRRTRRTSITRASPSTTTTAPSTTAIGKRPDGVQLTAIVSGKLKMTPERWAQLKGLYDGEVEHLDECFGALARGPGGRAACDDTPIVLLADHGEGFFEHGSMGHAYGQYAELTNVPLVVFDQGLGPRPEDPDGGRATPTWCRPSSTCMGVAADERVQGESLLPMMLREGPWVPRVAAVGVRPQLFAALALACTTWSTTAARNRSSTSALDPAEKSDIKDQRPLALRYFRDLAGIYLAHRAAWHTPTWGTLNNHRAGFAAK